MATFRFKYGSSAPLREIKLAVGEEAMPIVWTGDPGDPDLNALAAMPVGIALIDDLGPHGDPKATSRLFRITGLSQGAGQLLMWRGPASGNQQAGALTITVRNPDDRDADLLYRGRHVVWFRSLPSSVQPARPLVFAATSGLTGFQNAQFTGSEWEDKGPVPEHVFTFLAGLDPAQASEAMANKRHGTLTIDKSPAFHNDEPGIQFLPVTPIGLPVSTDWGTLRVRLFPVILPSGRGGFFLHNSRKGFSHGCIEVGTTSDGRDFFTTLLAYARGEGRGKTLRLKVKYSYDTVDTHGDTLR